MRGWLMNSSRFCVAPHGDFAGNRDDCYWGLPSIAADDPAYPPLGYWRGFVWGPMALPHVGNRDRLLWAGLPSDPHARRGPIRLAVE